MSSPVYYEILNYFATKPQAKDNVQGIVEWWILKERVDYSIDLVTGVLDQLVREEMVIEKTLDGIQKFYQLNPTKLDEIRSILNRHRAG